MSATPGVQFTVPARVPTSTTVATLVNASGSRRVVHIVNESAAILYVKFGAAASATDYTIALAATTGYYETPPGFLYGGIITGILASGTGFAQVTSY